MKKGILFAAMILLGGVCGYFVSPLPLITRFERYLAGLQSSDGWRLSEASLSRLAAQQPVDQNQVREQLDILQAQFPEGEWNHALAMAGISADSFESRLREHQRALGWIEQSISDRMKVDQTEITAFYEAHKSSFVSPLRRRARHIFFAAPNGSSPAIVEEKQGKAEAILNRLGEGEAFEAIATESEDEATKNSGGDLNFFSENRMPPEIWNVLAAQKVEGPPILVRSHLGFHVIQLTDGRSALEMAPAEAAPEIVHAIENAKRMAAVRELEAKARP